MRLDFIALTETWLDPSIKDSELSIPSFTLLRRDRSRHGGGVCLYVWGLTITSKWFHESAELLSISVQTMSELFLLSVLYRSPGLDLDLSELQVILGSLNLPHHRHAILVGDFNVNLSVSSSTGGASNLLDLMEAFGLSQCLHQPTRVTSTCSSLIDHVYANHPNLVSALYVGSPLSTSDHLSVCLHLSVISKLPKSPMRELWFYNKADFESIAEILDSLLAGLPNPSTSGVDKVWSNFKSTFLRIITEMVPHKLGKTRKSLPWLTKAAWLCMQMRDRAHREAKKFITASLWEKFRSLRNQTINILRKEKRAFFRSLSSRLTTCKAFWKAHRMLSLDRHPVPSCVTSGSVSATNPSDQADLLLIPHLCFHLPQRSNQHWPLPYPLCPAHQMRLPL